MDKPNRNIAIGALVVIALSIFYYFVIFLPSQEQRKLDFQKEQYRTEQAAKDQVLQTEANSKLDLSFCMDEAKTERNKSVLYWTDWSDKTCVGENNAYVNKCLGMVLEEVNKADLKQKESENKCIALYK
jgi:hypothetical protein